jgi:hypothetical protein
VRTQLELSLMLCFLLLTDTVTAFAWEPKGDRFLLITSNDPNVLGMPPGGTLKTSVSFYQLDTRKGDFLQLSESLLSNSKAVGLNEFSQKRSRTNRSIPFSGRQKVGTSLLPRLDRPASSTSTFGTATWKGDKRLAALNQLKPISLQEFKCSLQPTITA